MNRTHCRALRSLGSVGLAIVLLATLLVGPVGVSAAGTLVWANKAPMPAPRYSLGVVTGANGNIYAIGGWYNNAQSAVYEYNPTSNTWASKASMSTPRASAGVAESGGIIYVIGGVGGGVYTNTVEAYNGTSWSPRAPMSVSRDLLAAAASNGKIYAIGGRTSHSPTTVLTPTVEEYDPVTNTWATKSPMPTARRYLVAVTASNGKIYAIGGCSGSCTTALATVEAYDPATNTWTTETSMPTKRVGLGAAASGGKIYAIGGQAGTGTEGITAKVEEATLAPPTSSPATAPSASAQAGLVGYWNFNDGSGSVARDSSGNGNDGAISGATWSAGKFGNGLAFDGNADSVKLPPHSSQRPGRYDFYCLGQDQR